jgi:hypothetical protein
MAAYGTARKVSNYFKQYFVINRSLSVLYNNLLVQIYHNLEQPAKFNSFQEFDLLSVRLNAMNVFLYANGITGNLKWIKLCWIRF